MDSFNLYREAKEQYEKLIPEKKDGLILISLYSKYRTKDFSEENIIAIINRIFKDQGNESSRIENDRNNNIVLRLQESFLWRDEIKKTYQFKKYGLDFCQNIEKQLVDRYNPAKIKRFFNELLNSLNENIEQNNDFNLWIEDHFDIRMPSLSYQIEILDQQVNESVKSFKKNVKSEKEDILVILGQIEFGLEIIKEQASELRNAFQISYDIDEILKKILENQDSIIYIENIQKVQDFHDNSRSQLEQVSKRIEKIKPRIREFIYDFNKKDFDRKTNKFIYHLLNKSYVKKEASSKHIIFPNEIPDFRITSTDISPKYIVFPLRNISPKLPIEVLQRKVNIQKREELLKKTLKWKYDKERISYWTEIAFQIIENENNLNFSPLFFQIIEVEKLSIAVKTAHRILKISLKQKNKYLVTIKKEPFTPTPNTGISIWQMTIQKQ